MCDRIKEDSEEFLAKKEELEMRIDECSKKLDDLQKCKTRGVRTGWPG